ncbi:DNA-binding transcriptional regulator, MerR family [Microbispora rosea]|uniref:DNA-binding transcriptional regulator, MerR family n=1 Tax=Microbispora rosea TaxID=58117 RepID=A0A1N7DPK3_9ACTN|nr:MerR family transcriptional regulator [Microbispora rosea]GIH49297.1 MerR family transcriptional regulator [Microbispora rosea subsp. rosea]SIR77635.1 DNA-binding transcriptional regulator, MerR family [Microbispora rosea]
MTDGTELYTVGQIARRTGLSVHTIRFWSDSGLITPTDRSAGGYRLYDAAAVARFDLVRALRELGIGLEAVRRILARQATVAEVAEVHAQALDAEIKALKLRRAVLRTIARRGGTTEETTMTHRLAHLSAAQRQQVIDEFVENTFSGIALDDDAEVVAEWMRELPGELPDDPAPGQVDAWIELTDLVTDEDFRQRLRRIALAGASSVASRYGLELRSLALRHADRARAESIAPDSAEGRSILDQIVEPGLPGVERDELRRWLETVADARVERYWELIAVLNGREPAPPAMPALSWLLAAMRAHG